MKFWRRTLPVILCFIVGTFMVLSFYTPDPGVSKFREDLGGWLVIISSFALALGLASLLYMHTGKIRRQAPGWGFSVVTLTALTITASFGVFGGMDPGAPIYWIYNNLQKPMALTMFSLLAFFIASAAYKAFRARTAEATMLLIAGVIVMMGQIPFGGMWSGGTIPVLKDWILDVPNMGAQRAIYLGLALSMIATSLRVILGIERTYLGGGD